MAPNLVMVHLSPTSVTTSVSPSMAGARLRPTIDVHKLLLMRNRPSESPIVEASVHTRQHVARTIASPLRPDGGDLIRVGSRRWFLQTGLAGIGGLALPQLLAARNSSAPGAAAPAANDRKAVILFWLSGGPSHIDMWDPKPEAPAEIRGPYSPISTKVPGVLLSEHLPLQASIADKLSFLRAVDCKTSN